MPSNSHLLPLLADADGYTETSPGTVRAVRIAGDPVRCYTSTGPVDVQPGEWLLLDCDGAFWRATDADFKACYSPTLCADKDDPWGTGDDLDDLVDGATGGDGGRG